MWQSKKEKENNSRNESVRGVTIAIDINLTNLKNTISLDDLSESWNSYNCMKRSFNIQVFKGTESGIFIVSPENNELIEDFNICLPMWVDDKVSPDKVELVENSTLGIVDILANDNPVGFFKISDLIEVITGSPNLDRSNALACFSGIELQSISEYILSSNGHVEIPYNVIAYDIGANFINSVTKISLSVIK